MADESGDLWETSTLRSSPATFAHDELILAIVSLCDDDGLEQSHLFDGLRQLIQSLIIEMGTRLVSVGSYQGELHHLQQSAIREFPITCLVIMLLMKTVEVSIMLFTRALSDIRPLEELSKSSSQPLMLLCHCLSR